MLKKIKETSEDDAQAHICSWCWQNNLVPVAVPNGVNLNGVAGMFKANGLSLKQLGAINAKQILLLKKEGLHVGFPDMIITGVSLDGRNILFMENKVKDGKCSEIQLACHAYLRALGHKVDVSENSIDAIKKIKAFFGTNIQIENAKYLDIRKKILGKSK